MSNIKVTRFASNPDATLSIITVDGVFVCFGLEDEYRVVKVKGETRIPAGTYKIGLRKEGGFHSKYAAKFPSFHKGMLQVLNVPGFEYILIHIGNDDGDTEGCLLVGCDAMTQSGMTIQASGVAYEKLYKKVITAAEKGELSITYVDLDRTA